MTASHDWSSHFPLEAIQASRIGIITDVDGTISPIVSQPDAATVTPRNRDLLIKLQKKLALVAVVSGRAAADVHGRVGIPELVYVGNHGLERWVGDGVDVPDAVQQFRPQMETVRDLLRERTLPGMLVEDKIATLSVHYRNADNPEVAASLFQPIINAISEKHGLRVHEGRMIFEVRPPLDINKGTAFRALVEDYQLNTALYLGDDVTDVDALNMARHLRETGVCYGVAVGVESADDDTPPTVRQASDFLVDGVTGVEDFFDWFLNALSASVS
ncbi:MAG: trehalose-phosphatase [Aggregatilineales bacterium]